MVFDAAARAAKFLASLGQAFTNKRATAVAAMKDNASWPGLLLRLCEAPPAEPLDLGIEVDYLDDPGSCPLLLCTRRACWRWGPAVLPLSGSGALLVAASRSVNFFTVDICRLGQHGIALRDVPQFCETASGDAFVAEFCHFVSVPEGGALYMPPGHVATMVVIDPPGTADEGPDVGIAWAQHCFSKSRIAGLTDTTKAAMARFHSDHAARAEPRKLWACLHALFTKMLG